MATDFNSLWQSVQNMNPMLAGNIRNVNQQYGVGAPTNLTDFNRMVNSPSGQIQGNPAFDLSSYLGNWANRYSQYGGPQGTANMLQNTMSQTRQITDPYTGQVITRTAPLQGLDAVTNQLRGGLSTINQGYTPTIMPAAQQPISQTAGAAPVAPGPNPGVPYPAPVAPTQTPAQTPAQTPFQGGGGGKGASAPAQAAPQSQGGGKGTGSPRMTPY